MSILFSRDSIYGSIYDPNDDQDRTFRRTDDPFLSEPSGSTQTLRHQHKEQSGSERSGVRLGLRPMSTRSGIDSLGLGGFGTSTMGGGGRSVAGLSMFGNIGREEFARLELEEVRGGEQEQQRPMAASRSSSRSPSPSPSITISKPNSTAPRNTGLLSTNIQNNAPLPPRPHEIDEHTTPTPHHTEHVNILGRPRAGSRSSSDTNPSSSSGSPPPDFTGQGRPLLPPPIVSMDLRQGNYPRTSRTKRKELVRGLTRREQALYRWANVSDLDAFLAEVYAYFVGKGWQCILLKKILDLLTVGFVIAFTTFLLGCIDYSIIKSSHSLDEVIVKKCVNRLSGFTFLLVLLFSLFYLQRVVSFGFGVRKLWEMHDFFQELLEIPEGDLQTIPWHAVVSRLAALRESEGYSLSSMRSMGGRGHLDAHEVANRIMRSENYLIALFNKNVLDLSLRVPIPSAVGDFGGMFGLETRRDLRVGEKSVVLGGGLTKALEWNLGVCLLSGFLFGKDGQVRQAFMKEKNKTQLTEALKRRFQLMAIINGIFAFFIVIYLMIYSFFRYFEEYHKNPSSMGSRTYTQLARWKFREFNELPHLFQQRLNRSYESADAYIQQFPKEKTKIFSRFIAFVAGSFAAVLVLFSLLDPDAFLHFEITPGGTVLFYIGIFGTIMAVARGMVPDDHVVVDPEELMRSIADHTHYLPPEWKGRLHSTEVHQEFSKLFQMKITIFVQEIVSVILTPFILWFSLPSCAPAIVEFFRVCTVHVDGLGYVTSFAEFNFQRHGDPEFGAPGPVKDGRWMSNQGKMEKSILNFKAHNPSWVPKDEAQSLYLSKMTADLNHSVAPSKFGRSVIRKSRFGGVGVSQSPLMEEEVEAGTSGIQHGNESRLAEKKNAYEQAYQKSMGPSILASQSGKRRRKKEPYFVDEASSIDGEDYHTNMFASTEETVPEIPDDEMETNNRYFNLLTNVSLGGNKW